MSRSKRGQCGIAVRTRRLLVFGFGIGLELGCSVDNRVGRVGGGGRGNDDSAAATENDSAGTGAGGSAGAGNPGAAAAGAESGVNPALPLSMAAAGSGSGGAAGTAGGAPSGGAGGEGGGAAGANPGSGGTGTDPGETEPIGGCFQQLLSNAGFERGHVAWAETADVRDVIVRRDDPALTGTSVTPHAGDSLAWIGGVPNSEYLMYNTRLQQDVAIPGEAIGLVFSGYAWVAQPSVGQATVDWAVLEVEDPNPASNGVWQVQLWNDQSVTQSWEYFEVLTTDMTILSRLAGHTAPVVTYARPDGNGTLSVWLDSLRLEARCPR